MNHFTTLNVDNPSMNWLATHFKCKAEKIIESEGQQYLQELGATNSDVQATWLRLGNLKRGTNFEYNTPECGVIYSWVYHLKRTQQAIRVLFNPLRAAVQNESSIDIIDLGSGTGAVLWAVAALLLAFDEEGYRTNTPVRVLECDSSRFMLQTSVRLWRRLNRVFPQLQQRRLVCRLPSQSMSWDRVNLDRLDLEEPRSPWITASHLLHASEVASYFPPIFLDDEEAALHKSRTSAEDRIGPLKDRIALVADRVAASQIITWHSEQKSSTMRDVFCRLMEQGWARYTIDPGDIRFTEQNDQSRCITQAMKRWAHDYYGGLKLKAPFPGFWFDDLQDVAAVKRT